MNRLRVFSIVCFLVAAIAGCAQTGPVVEAPTGEITLPSKEEAPAVSPPVVAPETTKSHLVFLEAAEYIDRGQLKEAIRVYEKALQSRPESAMLRYNLGNVYFQSGLVDKAITEYERALVIDPQDRDSHINLGVAYYEKGLVEESISEYKKALAIDPDDPEAHYNLGVAYERKGLQAKADREFDMYRELTGKSL